MKLMPTEERLTVSVTDDQNIDFNANGSSVLVQLTPDGSVGTVDFQTTVDGTNYFNTPYVPRLQPGAVPITDQISPSGSSSKLYFLQGPLSQVRIKCLGLSAGTLSVVYRTIPGDVLDRQKLPYDYVLSKGEVLPTLDGNISGLKALRYETDEVFIAARGHWIPLQEGSLANIEKILLRMEEANGKILAILVAANTD